MSSYHINLFRYLVYKYYPLTKDFNQWLELKNGLTLDCAEQHGWCIKYSDKVKTEFVEEQFKGYPLKPNRLLIETDNSDFTIGEVYGQVARRRGIAVEELQHIVRMNFDRLFKL